MIKVLIADDEHMICEWLQFCISQNKECQLVGVAGNGREALELYHQTEPDLVLTDIKMPVMDGLELLHAIRAAGGRAKVVVLTAFAEFEMARQALRDGAAEYLLKTEMQNESLQKLLARIAHEQTLETSTAELASSAQAHSIIRKILSQEGELAPADLDELHQCGVRWRNNGLFALAVWKQELLSGGLAFPQEGQARHVAGFDYTDRIYVVVGNLPRVLSSAEQARQLTAYAKETQAMNDCMVGVSGLTDQMSQIPALVRQAAYSLAQGFYLGENRLYEPQGPLAALRSQCQGWKNEAAALRGQLYAQPPSQRWEALRLFLEATAARRMPSVGQLTRFCLDVLELLAQQAREAGLEPIAPEQTRARLAQSVSMAETTRLLLDFAAQCAGPEAAPRPRSKAVSLAVEQMRQNFGQPLSLEDVAAGVYLNPEYFSRIFKEEMGVSFVNYLTELRMARSVQLLQTTALRVQDIAAAVGYANVSYFSTTFKKNYGMSPYEYRRNS